MSTATLARPEASEYVAYFGRYITLVPDGPIIEILRDQIQTTLGVLRAVPEAKGDFRYAEGKWSIKEIVGHMADAERVFAYRALRFGRADEQALPGFEQDDYVRSGGFGSRTLRHLTDEFEAVRRATILLFEGFDGVAPLRRGVANGNPVTPRAIAYIVAGHELHHLRVLREHYLK